MRRNFFLPVLFLAAANFASAQIISPSTDVLGAHLNYGRGCAACHAPHSGAYGNGNQKGFDATAGDIALWGEDVGSLYGKTIVTGKSEHGSYTEALPATYGTQNTIPTLLGNDNTGAGNYLNDHPVGLNAVMSCGGTYDWDCAISASGKVLMDGPKSSLFIQNYGFFVSPGVYNSQPVVLCTTCHNQHVMNVVNVTSGVTITGSGATGTVTGKSGLPSGTYATMFFLRAPYNPFDSASNQTAQFCRQCHGGESNEMNGSSAGTIF
jgi:hypothetical protein